VNEKHSSIFANPTLGNSNPPASASRGVPAAMLRFSHFEVRQTSRFVQFSSLPGMSLKKSEVSK
jgi:hypothetical protein